MSFGLAKNVAGRNIFYCTNKDKIREERIFKKPAGWPGRQCHLARLHLERPIYNFKNSFPPDFIYVHRAECIFSRDMFCLYHFRAMIYKIVFAKTVVKISKVRTGFKIMKQAIKFLKIDVDHFF